MKKVVFLTGGTGNMGWATFQELNKMADRINIVLLARKSKKNEEKLLPYKSKSNVKIIWGDLCNYEDVLEGVQGCDYILHIGGMVSPAADWKPYATRRVNTTAANNIVKAVLAQPNKDDIKVCYIGSVAQTGDRNPPIHWGRCGDPIKISIYDHYATSKTIAEQIFVDSGIKNWVCMRQTGILYPSILKNMDPIMFHVPINGVLEWCTVEDSGRVMAAFVDRDLPSEFYNKFYNIGSGGEYRITNFQFEELLLESLGVPSTKELFEANWFTLKNFHGHYFSDSDLLEDYLHFRENVPIKDYFNRMTTMIPKYFTMARSIPNRMIRPLAKHYMHRIALTKGFGTLNWILNKTPSRISAYYGTREDWENIGNWDTFQITTPSNKLEDATLLNHGYDESKPSSELSLEDMKQAAIFRGGVCTSETMITGDMATKLKWKCQFGHEFEASPALILLGGHWCPECLPVNRWNYDEIAESNPFFAQVWYPNHTKEEHNIYIFDKLFEGWEELNQKKK